MRLIGLAVVLAVSMFLVPLAGEAQQPGKTYRIAVLVAGPAATSAPFIASFKQRLTELGYVEGKNLVTEFRYATTPEQLAQDADALVSLKPDVIVANVTPAAQAAKNATKTIPIVFIASSDPVAFGLVASLSRPGGNITGLSSAVPDASGKRLELLKEVIPRLTRVAVLWNSANPVIAQQVKDTEAAAKKLGVQVHVVGVRGPDEFEGALAASAKEHARALIVLSDFLTFAHRERIAELSMKNRLPAVSEAREFAAAGGLMAYGPNFSDLNHRSVYYVDKILKGAKPADLPVEQPTKFELVINLKTAKALGLTIPQSILIRADELVH
jgi:ABC-type uncharacterized transport system substrate-binding protein